MENLRIVVPAASTPAVNEAVLAEPGVTHTGVQQGGAVQPEGDVIETDVTREGSMLSSAASRGSVSTTSAVSP